MSATTLVQVPNYRGAHSITVLEVPEDKADDLVFAVQGGYTMSLMAADPTWTFGMDFAVID